MLEFSNETMWTWGFPFGELITNLIYLIVIGYFKWSISYCVSCSILCFWEIGSFCLSCQISSLTQELLRSVLFNLQVFGDFPPMFLLLLSTVIPMCSKTIFVSLFNLLRFVFWYRIHPILVHLPWALERICILLSLSEMFYKYNLDPFGWWFGVPIYLTDCLFTCSVNCCERGIKAPK